MLASPRGLGLLLVGMLLLRTGVEGSNTAERFEAAKALHLEEDGMTTSNVLVWIATLDQYTSSSSRQNLKKVLRKSRRGHVNTVTNKDDFRSYEDNEDRERETVEPLKELRVGTLAIPSVVNDWDPPSEIRRALKTGLRMIVLGGPYSGAFINYDFAKYDISLDDRCANTTSVLQDDVKLTGYGSGFTGKLPGELELPAAGCVWAMRESSVPEGARVWYRDGDGRATVVAMRFRRGEILFVGYDWRFDPDGEAVDVDSWATVVELGVDTSLRFIPLDELGYGWMWVAAVVLFIGNGLVLASFLCDGRNSAMVLVGQKDAALALLYYVICWPAIAIIGGCHLLFAAWRNLKAKCCGKCSILRGWRVANRERNADRLDGV
mmetsp:Transcript_15812/g.53664  ORF Transcript_15812/g.53664 Transcript_15812/m.53664 type:complete len:378 (+) Transcript_15812:52-1185(+)